MKKHDIYLVIYYRSQGLFRDSVNPKYYEFLQVFRSQFESVGDSNNLFRSFYQGTKLTRDNGQIIKNQLRYL